MEAKEKDFVLDSKTWLYLTKWLFAPQDQSHQDKKQICILLTAKWMLTSIRDLLLQLNSTAVLLCLVKLRSTI